MGAANGRRRYNATSSLMGWAHTQNDPCKNCSGHCPLSCPALWSRVVLKDSCTGIGNHIIKIKPPSIFYNGNPIPESFNWNGALVIVCIRPHLRSLESYVCDNRDIFHMAFPDIIKRRAGSRSFVSPYCFRYIVGVLMIAMEMHPTTHARR